jgi:hypothetical protein
MKTINVSDETYELIKGQLENEEMIEINFYDDLIGKCFFFRTVTYHQVGRVKKIVGKFLELSDASWVAESGRWMQALKDGELNEVEPEGPAFINIDTIVDFFPWKHSLPKDQK